MSKTSAAAPSIATEISDLSEQHLTSFVRAYYDYRNGKRIARHSHASGNEPIYFDARFGAVDLSRIHNLSEIKKTHPLLMAELKFYNNIVAVQEASTDEFDGEILYNFFGYLGGMYLNYDSSGIKLALPTDQSGDKFAEYCWRKLAVAAFFEQERVCWSGVAVLNEAESKSQLFHRDHEHWGVDELRDSYREGFESFISVLTRHIASRPNLFDTVCNAICGRRFYWQFFQEFVTDHVGTHNEPFVRSEKQFPAAVIYYNSGDQRRLVTDAPDPTFRLNRTVYRPNSKQLVEDCRAYLNRTPSLGRAASADTKLNLSDWIRPYKKFVFAQLGLGFSTNTTSHYRIGEEFNDFLIRYVAYRCENQRPPAMDNVHQQITTFIDIKQGAPDLVPVMERDGSVTTKPAHRFHKYINAEANLRLEEHIHEIKTYGSSLLGRKSSSSREMMVVSMEHPDTKRGNVANVIPLIQNIVAQGIEVEICIGAFRYSEGKHAGEVIEEISLACHVESVQQRQFIEEFANSFHQEYYLLIATDKKVTLVNLKSGVREPSGLWLTTNIKSPSALKPNQGYTVIDGNCFEAKPIENEQFLMQTNNYANVVTRHGEFQLSERQARVVKFLHEQKRDHQVTEVKNDDILRATGINGEALSRVFQQQVKGETVINKAWGGLIESAQRGYYRLIL